jgi:DNA invertase Pin-like site-specific DNA recombinase
MLHIYAALAEKERALISSRTQERIAAAEAGGVKLGGTNARSLLNRDGRPMLWEQVLSMETSSSIARRGPFNAYTPKSSS